MHIERLFSALALAFLATTAVACGDNGGTGGTGGNTGGTGGTGATGGSGATGGTGGSGATGATGGTGGTGATGGSGGAGGSTGGSGGAGGSGGSGGTGGSTACTWSAGSNPCGANEYCKAPGCGLGTCEPIGGTEDDTRAPVCGCDGVTYWNPTIAASHGMPLSTNSECGPAMAAQCGGFGGLMCPSGALCNYALLNKQQCGIADIGGECWAVPKTCGGGVGFGPITRECGAAVCKDECELIKAQVPWYQDNTCPQ